MYKRIIGIVICLSIIIGIMPISATAAEGSDKVNVQFNITGQWQDGFNAEMILTNNSSKAIENWKLNFDFPQEITNMWNAIILSSEDGVYSIKNADWNSDIAPHSQVSFGFSGIWDNIELIEPSNIETVSDIAEKSEENYDVDFQIMSDWGAGFSAQMTLNNLTDKVIESWHLEFDFDKNIDSIWNGVIDKTENGRYYISNAGYNSDIPPGGSITIGFNGSDGNVSVYPSDYALYGSDGNGEPMSDAASTPSADTSVPQISINSDAFDAANEQAGIYTITCCKDAITGGLTKANETESFSYIILNSKDEVKSEGDIEISESWSIQNFVLDIGLNKLKLTAAASGGKAVEKEISILNLCVENTDIDPYEWESDDDGDGLTNYIEEYIGTDKFTADTDGDGLPDGYEILILCTDPLQFDTDGNGITDADEDFDNDGLINYEEYILGTNPNCNDSDNDGLTDKAEVYSYNTDPLNPDTDGDELEDGVDVKLGFDPTLPDTDGNGIIDSKEYVLQTYTYDIESEKFPEVTRLVITARAQGLLDDKVIIRDMYDINMISTDLVKSLGCVVGAPLKIQLLDGAEDAEVSFVCTDKILGIDKLGVLVYDYDKNEYNIANTENTANTISINDFADGEYIVSDISKWSDNWNDYIFEQYHVFTDEEIRLAKENSNRPVTMQTAAQQIYCEELPAFTRVDVSFETSDIIECTTDIENVYNVDMYSTKLVGLVGAPVDIHTDSEFTEATVTFTYDREKLGDTKEENLGVLWYDAENHDYVKMDSTVDTQNCTLSFKTTHFSEYMPYDKAQYDILFEKNSQQDHGNDKWQGKIITPDEYQQILKKYGRWCSLSDMTAIANGGSLYIALARTEYNFPEELGTLSQTVSLVSNKTLGEMELFTINYYKAFAAIALENTTNFFVLDSVGTYKLHEGIPTCPYYDDINKDNPGNIEILEKYYIPAYFFDNKDTDSDMLYDIYEYQGMRMTNGVKCYTDFENPDMDNDGMLDGEEIIRRDVKDGYFAMLSDPNKTDSDDDGIDDYYDLDPLYKNDADSEIKLSDIVYDGRAEIFAYVKCFLSDNRGDAKVTIKFDNPSQVKNIAGGNSLALEHYENKWNVELADGVNPQSVKYTVIIENKGKELFRKKSTLSAPKVEYSTKVWMRIGDKSIVSNDAFVSFRYTSKYAKNANILLTSNGNESYNKNLKGADAKKHEFSWSLPMLGSNYFKLTVNKGTETEYKKNYPINMVCGEEFTYPENRAETDNQEVTDKNKLNVKTSFGNLDENGNCIMSITVNEPYAQSINVKVLDENNNIAGTAAKDNMLYANDSYTSSFSVKNNKKYNLEIKLNAKSVSEKTYYDTVYVDSKKGVGAENSPVITQTEMNLFENDKMAPGAYTYLMYFTYEWYLADSERDKKIYADAIKDIRSTGYTKTGSKYWDDLISGMPHRPNENMTQEEHYYRNRLNIEYQWEDFQKLQITLPEHLKWRELPLTEAAFHKFGQANNRKYVSACGHFEIVYTKENYLVDEKFSPLNMGTYNYCGPNQKAIHAKVDVAPWGIWGNTSKGWIYLNTFR